MARKLNETGIEHIKRWEGVRLKAYRCSAGVSTIGVGHTSMAGPPPVYDGMTITREQADEIFRRDIVKYERAVEEAVKVKLSDNQFATLVSLCFNIGPTAFAKSNLVRKLNAGQYDAVPAELMKWVTVKGRRVDGLVNRRAAEAGLWAKGSFVSSRDEKPKPKPPVVTLDNVSKLTSILTSILSAITSNTAQIIFVSIFCVVTAYLAFRWYRSYQEEAA